MKTLYLKSNETQKAAEIIKNGGIVAIPTETVYGLAANTFNEESVKKIFLAKGRPSDNPLIVHIAEINDIYRIVSDFPNKAKKLAEKFWPGPLTMILPKKSVIPSAVTASMNSVAVRFPSHLSAQEIIKKSGVPLVAPSANSSGSPSPTNANHVLKDLNGKIDAVLDGGECSVGLESTVISLVEETPRLLRPGAVTPDDIRETIGDIIIDNSVYSKLDPNTKAISPGTKYKHYSPKAKVILIKASSEKYIEFVNSKFSENLLALCFDEDISRLKVPYISYGSKNNYSFQAKKLFESLRKADEKEVSIIYAHACAAEGIGIAVYNRLIRAAGFDVLEL